MRLRLKGPFKTKKSSPRYIGPYQIVDRVGEITYPLALLPPLFGFHDVFHVSQLRKFVPDPFQPILSRAVDVATNLTFQPQPTHIIDYIVKTL